MPQLAGAVLDYYHTKGLYEAKKTRTAVSRLSRKNSLTSNTKEAKSNLQNMDFHGRPLAMPR